jgi:hypothetical protein
MDTTDTRKSPYLECSRDQVNARIRLITEWARKMDDLPHGGELTADFRGKISTIRQLSTINRHK